MKKEKGISKGHDMSLSEFSDALINIEEKRREQFAKEVEEINSTLTGKRVRQKSYLLEGIIQRADPACTFFLHPQIIVKWDNGAETIENGSTLDFI